MILEITEIKNAKKQHRCAVVKYVQNHMHHRLNFTIVQEGRFREVLRNSGNAIQPVKVRYKFDKLPKPMHFYVDKIFLDFAKETLIPSYENTDSRIDY